MKPKSNDWLIWGQVIHFIRPTWHPISRSGIFLRYHQNMWEGKLKDVCHETRTWLDAGARKRSLVSSAFGIVCPRHTSTLWDYVGRPRLRRSPPALHLSFPSLPSSLPALTGQQRLHSGSRAWQSDRTAQHVTDWVTHWGTGDKHFSFSSPLYSLCFCVMYTLAFILQRDILWSPM